MFKTMIIDASDDQKWDVVCGFGGYGVIFASFLCVLFGSNRLCAHARARVI